MGRISMPMCITLQLLGTLRTFNWIGIKEKLDLFVSLYNNVASSLEASVLTGTLGSPAPSL